MSVNKWHDLNIKMIKIMFTRDKQRWELEQGLMINDFGLTVVVYQYRQDTCINK